VRKENPEIYPKLIAWLIPRELIPQRERAPDIDPAELTEQEVMELIEAEHRRQMNLSALKTYR
jgi:hypothetical protein